LNKKLENVLIKMEQEINECIEITKGFQNYGVKEDLINFLYKSGFQTQWIAQITEELFGVGIDFVRDYFEKDNSYPRKGVMIVMIKNPNSHNYAIGKPYLAGGGSVAYRPDGSTGNNFPKGRYYIRPAKEDEIHDFFKRKYEKVIKELSVEKAKAPTLKVNQSKEPKKKVFTLDDLAESLDIKLPEDYL